MEESCDEASVRGLQYLRTAFGGSGGEGLPMFAELALVARSEALRSEAAHVAKRLMEQLEAAPVLRRRAASGLQESYFRESFFQTLFLAFWKKVSFGDTVDELLWRADILFDRYGYRDSNKLFGINNGFTKWAEEELEFVDITPEDWRVLLMRIWVVEYMNLLFGDRWPTQYGLQQALVQIKQKIRVRGPPHKPDLRFYHSLRLVAQLVLAFSAHSQSAVAPVCPWILHYLRVALVYWLKQCRKREKSIKKGRMELVHVDLHAIAECTYCLQLVGVARSDPMVNNGLQQLLSNQRQDGSWAVASRQAVASMQIAGMQASAITKQQHTSRQIHTVWACTRALASKTISRPRTAELASWGVHVASTLTVARFGTLCYYPKWQTAVVKEGGATPAFVARAVGGGGGNTERAVGGGGGNTERAVGGGGGNTERAVGGGGGYTERAVGGGGGYTETDRAQDKDAMRVFPGRVWKLTVKYLLQRGGQQNRREQGQRKEDGRTEGERQRLADLLMRQELASTAAEKQNPPGGSNDDDDDDADDEDEDESIFAIKDARPLALTYLLRSKHVAWRAPPPPQPR
jgi:hypothetical protein